MQFTVLGCYSPFPAPDGATPGYLVTTKSGKHVLIDCGSGVLAQLIKYWPLYELDMVVLSHLHHDHISDFFVLQYAMMTAMRQGWRTEPLTVYAPTKPGDWAKKLHYHSYIDVHELNEEIRITVDDYTEIRPYLTAHGVPCYALQIKDREHTILYGADSGPATNWGQMKKYPDIFVCEATYLHSDLPKNMNDHLSARQAGEAANTLLAKQLLLTHLYPYYDKTQLQKEASNVYKGDCNFSQTGLQIRL
jgi:ribonuclease BN (tRNA processing enzyme)